MMIKISPLIRSKTLNAPYPKDFVVYPRNFCSDDINWALDLVTEAMRDVREKGIRLLVASRGDKKIAGIACWMQTFATQCLRDEENTEAQKHIKDNRNRNFDVFLGYAFKTSGSELPDVTPSDIWQMLKETLIPKWELSYIDPIAADYCEPKGIRPSKTSFPDEELLKKYLAEAIKGDVTVIIENSSVKKIPPPQPKRIPLMPPESPPPPPPPKPNPEKKTDTIQKKHQEREDIHKKPTKFPVKLALAILSAGSVAAAILYWLMK